MSRALIAAVLIGISAPAWAQQVDPSPIQADVRFQVQVFEVNLRSAVQRGGQQLAKRAREVRPDVSLQFAADPIVRGVIIPSYGAVFDVQIPEIMDTGLELWRILASRGIPPPVRPAEPGRVSNATVVSEPAPMFDPDKEYTNFMRLALIDAMLDNALALTIPEGQMLTIIAGGISGGPTNPLGAEERKLILRIKGEDLIALRQGRMTREEAKQKILESRY